MGKYFLPLRQTSRGRKAGGPGMDIGDTIIRYVDKRTSAVIDWDKSTGKRKRVWENFSTMPELANPELSMPGIMSDPRRQIKRSGLAKQSWKRLSRIINRGGVVHLFRVLASSTEHLRAGGEFLGVRIVNNLKYMDKALGRGDQVGAARLLTFAAIAAAGGVHPGSPVIRSDNSPATGEMSSIDNRFLRPAAAKHVLVDDDVGLRIDPKDLSAEACADRVGVGAAATARFGVDGVLPGLVVRPGTQDEVHRVMAACAAANAAVIPWGGGTAMGLGNPPRRAAASARQLDDLVRHPAGDAGPWPATHGWRGG
jgi:hypothetical protein